MSHSKRILFILKDKAHKDHILKTFDLIYEQTPSLIQRVLGIRKTEIPYQLEFFSDISEVSYQLATNKPDLLVLDCTTIKASNLHNVFQELARLKDVKTVLINDGIPPDLSVPNLELIRNRKDIFITRSLFNPFDLDHTLKGLISNEQQSAELLADKKAIISDWQKYLECTNKLKKQKAIIDKNFNDADDYLDNIINTLNSAIICTDSNYRVKLLNNASLTFINGKAEDDILDNSIYDSLPFLDQFKDSIEAVLNNDHEEQLQKVNIGVEDDQFINVCLSALTYKKEKGVLIKIDDVTEAIQKDEHLRQAQKMDSVGSLAAGLAHDFNNIIGGITATVSSIQFSMDMANTIDELKEGLSDDIEIIEESAQRGSDMIEQLLALSKKKELEFSTIDLNDTIKNVVKICNHTFGSRIEVDTQYSEENAIVTAYPTQLEQCILNLCINASHAMTFMRGEDEDEHGGTLTISLEKIAVGANMASMFPDAQEGNYWLLAVNDTGIGMNRETVSKIFEPFFSTKNEDKGTGLGLSVVYNIVRQHKGFLEVYSEPNVGSTFMVFLPAVEESIEE